LVDDSIFDLWLNNRFIEFPQSIVAVLKVQIKMLFFKFRYVNGSS